MNTKVRRIPNTDCNARLDYRSEDGSVRQYTIHHPAHGILGRVEYVRSRYGQRAGYKEQGSAGTFATWHTLTEAAEAMLAWWIKTNV